MTLSDEEKEFLDRILDKAYEFIDGIDDWGWDHGVPELYRNPDSENDIVDAVVGIRCKLGMTGKSVWQETRDEWDQAWKRRKPWRKSS